jgi:hypothetical protein
MKHKKTTKMQVKLMREFTKLSDLHVETVTQKEKLDKDYTEIEGKFAITSEKLKNLMNKFYRTEKENDNFNIDPFELHKKIRYYESQLEIKDLEFLEMFKDFKDYK